MARTKQPTEWATAAETKLSDDEIAYWLKELPICDYMSRGGRLRFFSALSELAELRAAGVKLPDPPTPPPLPLPKPTLRNIVAGVKDQGPWRRALRNFVVTRNAWGLFHRNAHFSRASGKEKVEYETVALAEKACVAMQKRYDVEFETYKCIFCNGFHIGRNQA